MGRRGLLAALALGVALAVWLSVRPPSDPTPEASVTAVPAPAPAITETRTEEAIQALKAPPPTAATPSASEPTTAAPTVVLPAVPASPTLPPELSFTVLTDENGQPLRTTRADAQRACAGKGMRLPTIRELALEATAHGARVEDGKVPAPDADPPAELIKATNADGSTDSFAYTWAGYRTPPGLSRSAIYWSSSDCVGCVIGTGETSTHAMHGDGKIQDYYDTLQLAVRCVATPISR